jgi:hypothetical protein
MNTDLNILSFLIYSITIKIICCTLLNAYRYLKIVIEGRECIRNFVDFLSGL